MVQKKYRNIGNAQTLSDQRFQNITYWTVGGPHCILSNVFSVHHLYESPIGEWWEIIKRERCMNLWDKFRWNNQITQSTLSKYGVFQYLMYFISHTIHKYRNSLNDLINFSDFSDNLSNWESTFSFKIHRFMMENGGFLIGFRLFSSPYSSPITIIGTFFTENPLKK